MTMKRFRKLQLVALDIDLPEHDLRKGDIGTVVHVYRPDGLEVEFLSASGATTALVTLKRSNVHAAPATESRRAIRAPGKKLA